VLLKITKRESLLTILLNVLLAAIQILSEPVMKVRTVSNKQPTLHTLPLATVYVLLVITW
jgi:hypothetical protein